MRRLALLLSVPTLFLAAESTVTEMSLPTPDGFRLAGTLTVPEGRGKHPLVIFAHGFRSNSAAWGSLPEKLQERGLATLVLDLRGHGASTEQAGSTVSVTSDFAASSQLVAFDQIPNDLTLAANWARRQKGVDGRHVGLAGANLGAFAALMAAPKIKPATILALSPDGMDAFGRDARARMATATIRAHAAVMAFVSMEDREADENAEPLRPLYGANIRTFEGNRRGLDFLADHSDVMAVFFAEYLLHPHTGRVAEAPKVAAAPEATVLTPEAQAPTTP